MGIPSSPEIHRKRKTLKNFNNSGGSSTGIVKLPEGKVEITMSQRKIQVSPEALQAFQVYQRYDDWASETEKTDYTYSNLSQYKDREVIPGFRLRPNLSRRPIKPSSPQSVYDYTSEGRLEPLFYSTPLSNRSRVSRNVSERESYYEEEAEEVDALVHQETWLNKFTQLFSIFLTTLMSSVSRSYGAIAYTLSSVAFFLSSVSRRALSALSFSKTQGGYASKNSLVQGQNGVRSWVTRTTDYIWKYTLTIVTTITTIYHEAAIEARRSNKKKYLWLLLIPLLLLIGCYYDILPSIFTLSPIKESLSYVLSLFCPQNIMNFLCYNLPYFVMETIPYFFHTTLPDAILTVVPHFFTNTIPEFFWAFCDLILAAPGVLLAVLQPLSLLSAGYGYLLYAFTIITTSVYSFYSWVWYYMILAGSSITAVVEYVAVLFVSLGSSIFELFSFAGTEEVVDIKDTILPEYDSGLSSEIPQFAVV